MKKLFTCNYFPKTDGAFIDKRKEDIGIRLHGNERGQSNGDYWTKTVVLSPEDAALFGDTLQQMASEFGIEVPDAPQEDTVEVFCKQETKVTEQQINEIMNKSKVLISTEFEKCTVVTVKLPNGFTITESSGCVDPANYDVHLGAEICLKKIRNKVWELEGYALQKKVHEEGIL